MTDDLKVKISRMYHISGISKSSIGTRLGISRFRVSRLLEQARREGIVEIEIVEPVGSFAGIEEELEKRFGLYQAVVVGSNDLSDSSIMREIGKAGASRLLDLLADGDVLGVTWGATVNEVVKALPSKVSAHIEVVQTTGGVNQAAIGINAIELVSRVATIFDARSYLLYAPAIVNSISTRDALMSDGTIRATTDMFSQITVAISGIGAFYQRSASNLLSSGSVDNKDFAALRHKKACGDIFTHFFDIQGNICDTDLEQRIIGMSVEQLRNLRYSIGVAGGLHKSMAILGALRTKLINILFTDYATAYDILDKDTTIPD